MSRCRTRSSNLRGALTWICAVLYFCALSIGNSAQAASANNPCSLLTVAEVEAVFGEPLAGPPFRVGGAEPSATGDICRYETASFRAIDVEVDWAHGEEAFGAINMVSGAIGEAGLKGVLTLSDGTKLRGAWDEARMFLCCAFNALRGDQRVVIDISATKLTEMEAGTLADKAVGRLEQPLDVADDVGVDEAIARDKTRPVVGSACTLVTRAEAEAIVGAPLVGEPEGDESGCTYSWTPAGSDYQMQFTLLVTWRGGYGEFRATQGAIGMGLDMLSDQGLDVDQGVAQADPVFDEYSTSMIGVMAVRKDVFMSIESGPGSDAAAQFIATAAAKL